MKTLNAGKMRRMRWLVIRGSIVLTGWSLGTLAMGVAGSNAGSSHPVVGVETTEKVRDLRYLAQGIRQQQVPLRTPATVTDSTLAQYRERPPRRKPSKNVTLDTSALIVTLFTIAVALKGYRAFRARQLKQVSPMRPIKDTELTDILDRTEIEQLLSHEPLPVRPESVTDDDVCEVNSSR